MKISKSESLNILAKHIIKKLINTDTIFVDTSIVASSLSILLNAHLTKLKSLGIIDNEDRVDIDVLEKQLLQIFSITPILNIPIAGGTFNLTKDDAINFINDLTASAEIDDVIYLSCQNC